MIRRATVTLALALATTAVALLAAPDGAAFADPAGPTDYESEIVGLDPEVATIDVEIVGGDSFVLLDVRSGVEVTVLGYRGEPYLLFDTDGDVWENRRSPATYENSERYGVGSLPPEADHTAEPEWRRVGSGGSWAWHDHRAHRMDPFPPVNAERGDQVLDAVVPLVVDGVEVDVRVASTWMPAPSRWPGVGGAAAGVLVLALLRRRLALALAVVSGAAFGVGVVQFGSLPSATKPLWLWWVAPAIAFAAALAAVAADTRRRAVDASGGPAPLPLWAHGATLIAAAQLLVWGVERRDGLVRAVLPTDLPFWIDRAVSAAALSAGALGAAIVLTEIVRTWVRPPAPVRSRS